MTHEEATDTHRLTVDASDGYRSSAKHLSAPIVLSEVTKVSGGEARDPTSAMPKPVWRALAGMYMAPAG